MYEQRRLGRSRHSGPVVARDAQARYHVSAGNRGPTRLSAALALLEEAAAALHDVDVTAEEGRALLDSAVELQRLRNRVDAAHLGVLAEAEERGPVGADGAASLASWLASRTRQDHHHVARQTRTARRLRRFPLLAQALADGAANLSHVQVVTDAAIPQRRDALQAVEQVLVELTRHGRPRDVARAVQRVKDAADRDGSDADPLDETGPDPRRKLDLARTIEGLGDLRASLDPLTHEKLASLIDAYTTPDDPDTPPHARRSAAQRRHDAFDRILDRLLQVGGHPTVHGSQPQIIAMVDLAPLLGIDPDAIAAHDLARLLADPDTTPEQLRAHFGDLVDPASGTAAGTGGTPGVQAAADQAAARAAPAAGGGAAGQRGHRARLRYHGEIPNPVLWRLMRNARLLIVLTLGPWRVVNIGRTQRTIPAWMRGLLHLMHQRCRGPDCDLPPTWTQSHHADLLGAAISGAWNDNAPTDLNATVPLCQFHHDLITSGGWTLAYDPDTARCRWTNPAGQTIITYPPAP